MYIYICVPWHGMPDSSTTLNVFVGAGSSSTTGSIDNRSSCLIAALSRNCRVFHFLDFFSPPRGSAQITQDFSRNWRVQNMLLFRLM